jgi:hypothetical protein
VAGTPEREIIFGVAGGNHDRLQFDQWSHQWPGHLARSRRTSDRGCSALLLQAPLQVLAISIPDAHETPGERYGLFTTIDHNN